MDCTALYFPGTSPSRFVVEALLLVHETVCWYQPVEGLPMGELELMAQRGLVQAIVPASFGDDRQRFELTVRDLLAQGQAYQGAYLAAMAAAAEPGRSTPGWEIVAGLSDRSATVDQGLWQARLFLQLQAVLDQQEREISQGLAALAEEKIAMLSLLQGKEKMRPAARTARPASLSPSRTTQLVRAWTRLFFAAQSAERPLLLATDQEGAAALLLSDCEKFFKKSSQPVLELVLPELAGLAMDDFFGRLETFRQQAAPVLLELRRVLLSMAVEPGDELPAAPRLSGLATRWREKVSAHFGPVSDGAAVLVCHRLPGVSLTRLMAAQNPLGDGSLPASQEPASGLLAVVETR